MIALVMIFVLLIYALLSAFIIYTGGKTASWLGYDPTIAKKRIKILWFAPVIIWLVWDLPTIPLHKYYCATQAGFFVYKTPEQWLKEHPEVTREELKPYSIYDESQHLVLNAGTSKAQSITKLNRRFIQSLKVEKISWWNFFPVSKRIEYIEDSVTGETLAELISFMSGYKNPLVYGGFSGFKGWLSHTSCSQGNNKFLSRHSRNSNARAEYENFTNKLTTLGEE